MSVLTIYKKINNNKNLVSETVSGIVDLGRSLTKSFVFASAKI